jgi:hypothetical protein
MTKINQLVNNWPRGSIKTVKELAELGYTPQLLKVYANSKWIELTGRGMYKLFGDEVTWEGILYGLQKKNKTTLHAGGKTALNLKGYSHYINLVEKKIYFFSDRAQNFNSWFQKNEQITLNRTKIFNYENETYFTDHNTGNFKIKISTPELAMMEVLYLLPKEQSFDEAIKLVEGLTTLRPELVQQLLEDCQSVKIKRLFLFMAEKNHHQWFNKLELNKISLGNGKRVIVPKGVLDKKYQITVPKEYAE